MLKSQVSPFQSADKSLTMVGNLNALGVQYVSVEPLTPGKYRDYHKKYHLWIQSIKVPIATQWFFL
jgi:hypothetical protein